MTIEELQLFMQEGRERVERESRAIDVTPTMIEAAPAAD